MSALFFQNTIIFSIPLYLVFNQAVAAPLPQIPNIVIFDSTQSSAQIQQTIDTIYAKQMTNHFGTDRYALLFKPGTYHLDVKVGYYTQVLGLGRSPDNVTIIGAIRTEDDRNTEPIDHGPGALNNFWRSVENLTVIPTLGSLNRLGGGIPKDENVWAVSQASPMRNVHIKSDTTLASSGSLRLFDIGWSSGGYLANSKIDGYVEAGSQQQWFTRNSEWNVWRHGNWNILDMGSLFAVSPALPQQSNQYVPENSWNTYPFTSLGQTPKIAEKPSLAFDNDGNLAVLLPPLVHNSRGVHWGEGRFISLQNFYIANPTDSIEQLNAELAKGKNLLFSPGVYKFNSPLRIVKANTIVLGLGLPSLSPTTATPVISVADVDNVRIAGIILDAGPELSPSLLEVGNAISTINHAAAPTVLSDIFCRVGGANPLPSRTKTCVQINSNDVIGDNFWLWRADHGINNASIGWNINTAPHGLIVNGARVTIYGLAVEHFQEIQTLWNGEDGNVYFYQSELPYDPPNQESWKNASSDGFASYKVADKVERHTAIGLGVYCYFRDASNIFLENAIEAPNKTDIHLQNMISVWLDGKKDGSPSGIRHILNGKGLAVISNIHSGNRVAAWAK